MIMRYALMLFMFTGDIYKSRSLGVGKGTATDTDAQEPCTALREKDIRGYYGFPLSLKYGFDHKLALFRLFKSAATAGLNASCSVIDELTGEVVKRASIAPFYRPYTTSMNVAYEIDGITSPSNYTLRCGFPKNSSFVGQNRTSLCLSEKVVVILHNVTSRDCTGDSVNGLVERQLTRGKLYSLSCGIPGVLKTSSKITAEWFRYQEGQCKEDFGPTPTVSESNKLRFISADFEDAGMYMCMATFNGRKMLISKLNVCVRYPRARNRNLTLLCNNGKTTTHGNVNISCTINLSVGKFDSGYFIWYKIASDVIEICNKSFVSNPKKFDCSEVTSLPKEGCYQSKPPEGAANDMRTTTLTINNVEESDFGKYQLEYYPTSNTKLVSNLTVARDIRQKQRKEIFGIAIGVSVCAFLIAFMLISLFMKIEILWFVKKHYGKAETGDPGGYTANFLYTYDLEKQYTAVSMRNTRVIVESVEAIVKKIGGTVYDEHRDVPRYQYDTENTMEMHQQCLRIIIFLSPEFVTDHWSRFATYTAVEAAIREGKKIIFISMPDTMNAIKKIEDDSRRTLQNAMKRNVTIHWNGKVPLARKFHMHLEYALPKLKTP